MANIVQLYKGESWHPNARDKVCGDRRDAVHSGLDVLRCRCGAQRNCVSESGCERDQRRARSRTLLRAFSLCLVGLRRTVRNERREASIIDGSLMGSLAGTYAMDGDVSSPGGERIGWTCPHPSRVAVRRPQR